MSNVNHEYELTAPDETYNKWVLVCNGDDCVGACEVEEWGEKPTEEQVARAEKYHPENREQALGEQQLERQTYEGLGW